MEPVSTATEGSEDLCPSSPSKAAPDELRSTLHDALIKLVKERVERNGSIRAGLSTLEWLEAEAVANEAGVDAGVFDHIWEPRQTPEGIELSPYESFLFDCFGEHHGPAVDAETAETAEEYSHELESLVRLGMANIVFEEDHWVEYLVALAFSMMSMHQRPDQVNLVNELEYVYDFGIYMVGRRLREPFTARHVALCALHLLEGHWFQRISGNPDPNPIVRYRPSPESAEEDWHVAGIAMLGFIKTVTEPR